MSQAVEPDAAELDRSGRAHNIDTRLDASDPGTGPDSRRHFFPTQ